MIAGKIVRLKILLPIKVPKTTLLSFLDEAMIDVSNSGSEVAIAVRVRPKTVVER